YDDVLAKQRSIVYADRHRILNGEDVRDIVLGLIDDEIAEQVDTNCPGVHSDEWDTVALYNAIGTITPLPPEINPESLAAMSQDEVTDALTDAAHAAYEDRERTLSDEVVRAWERRVLLVTMSGLWIHHVDAMDELREAAMLEAFAQQDPLVQYKRKSFDMFEQFQTMFRKNVVYQIYHILWQPTASLILEESRLDEPEAEAAPEPHRERPRPVLAGGLAESGRRAEKTAEAASTHAKRSKTPTANGKIGRNEPCFCGSGKKYKYCHGRSS
ncbi:MAG: SEC-C metal-binding domain-containing protein, partial [Chloroflexota bacterium]